MGRLHHLQETLGTWVNQPGTSCVVVDYSCPDRCGDWVEQNYPQVQVIRVTGQSHFHAAHARNVGASAAEAPWLCFIDGDIALAPAFAETVIPLLRPGHYFRVLPHGGEVAGTFICQRADFAKVEGYDEVFQGWGVEDADLYGRLKWLGLSETGFPAHLLRPLSHDDGVRVRFHAEKRKNVNWTINRQYLRLKFDLMKLVHRLPSLEVRQTLYGQITNWVRTALANPGRRCDFRVSFCRQGTPLKGAIECFLLYTLTLDEVESG
jgi:glycosyltransferase involved in cell wall biosynthesis